MYCTTVPFKDIAFFPAEENLSYHQETTWLEHVTMVYIHAEQSLSNKATLFAKNCGHIREVAFGERENHVHDVITLIVVAAEIYGHTREGGLC